MEVLLLHELNDTFNATTVINTSPSLSEFVRYNVGSQLQTELCYVVKHILKVCNAIILPSHWSQIVQKQVKQGQSHFSPYYKTLYNQNDLSC